VGPLSYSENFDRILILTHPVNLYYPDIFAEEFETIPEKTDMETESKNEKNDVVETEDWFRNHRRNCHRRR